MYFISLLNESVGAVSRSEARRLLNQASTFSEIVVDFDGINMISPSFADEIFRVYQNSHSNVDIRWINANESVSKMIQKVLHTDKQE